MLPVDRRVVGRQLGLQLPGDRDRQGPLVRLHHERRQRGTPGAEHLRVVEGRHQVALGLRRSEGLARRRASRSRQRRPAGSGPRPTRPRSRRRRRSGGRAGPIPRPRPAPRPVAARASWTAATGPARSSAFSGIDRGSADDGRLAVEADGRRADLRQWIQRLRAHGQRVHGGAQVVHGPQRHRVVLEDAGGRGGPGPVQDVRGGPDGPEPALEPGAVAGPPREGGLRDAHEAGQHAPPGCRSRSGPGAPGGSGRPIPSCASPTPAATRNAWIWSPMVTRGAVRAGRTCSADPAARVSPCGPQRSSWPTAQNPRSRHASRHSWLTGRDDIVVVDNDAAPGPGGRRPRHGRGPGALCRAQPGLCRRLQLRRESRDRRRPGLRQLRCPGAAGCPGRAGAARRRARRRAGLGQHPAGRGSRGAQHRGQPGALPDVLLGRRPRGAGRRPWRSSPRWPRSPA